MFTFYVAHEIFLVRSFSICGILLLFLHPSQKYMHINRVKCKALVSDGVIDPDLRHQGLTQLEEKQQKKSEII